jgi:signal transduction histidine kinase
MKQFMDTQHGVAIEEFSFHKSMLALDALSKMANRFSRHPDFQALMEVLLLTLSGQFSVSSAFAILYQPGALTTTRKYFFGSGKFKNDQRLQDLELPWDVNEFFSRADLPQLVDDLVFPDSICDFEGVIRDCNVRMLAPLIHDRKFIGIVGLGPKVTGKDFDADEISLMATVENTVAPFVAYSFLFTELRSLNTWYLEILNGVKQGVFVFDSDDKLKMVNNSGVAILRSFSPDLPHKAALTGLPINLIFPDPVFCGWIKRINRNRSDHHGQLIESLAAKAYDTERIYNLHVTPIGPEPETASERIITLHDVTIQKQSEQRLFDLEKFAEKGVMASSISHELNNFLGLILGGVEIAGMALNKNNTEKVAATLDKLKANVGKMERFTHGLMDYTKLNSSKQVSDLNTVIADVLSFLTGQKRFTGIAIDSELDASIPPFDIDTDQISQLLLNLLNNAGDAIREANRPGQICIRTQCREDAAVLSISDNGVGIKPEIKDRLFKNHLTTKEKGHGYGLVTCGRVLDNHHAEVTIDTELGVGTTFTLVFPLEPEE